MLPAALGRNGGHGAFHQLQQRLLHALARHVAGDRGIFRLAGDLVDLVDIDDAALRPFDVVFRGLEKLQDDVLDILAHVTGFGQRGGVRHGERHGEDPRQRLGQQRLAAARGADQQDVRLRQLDVRGLPGVVQTLVMVVHGDREHPLRLHLPDDVIIEDLADLERRGHAVRAFQAGGFRLLPDDVHAEFDAFVADEHGRTRDQLAHFVLALAAEAAIERVLAVATRIVRHFAPFARFRAAPAVRRPTLRCVSPQTRAAPRASQCQKCLTNLAVRFRRYASVPSGLTRLSTISSIRPHSLASSGDMKLSRSSAFSTVSRSCPVWRT